MQPLHFNIISIPGSLKTCTWKLSPTLASQITENHKSVVKVDPRRLPNLPKIDKSRHLDLSVSIGCPPGPKDQQNGVPGIQNGTSRSPK